MEQIKIFLIIMNAIGLLLMLVDKARARKKLRRISEINLLVVAICGGALGSIVGMCIAHHKTKHKKFTIGLPIILAVQIILFVIYILQ